MPRIESFLDGLSEIVDKLAKNKNLKSAVEHLLLAIGLGSIFTAYSVSKIEPKEPDSSKQPSNNDIDDEKSSNEETHDQQDDKTS